MFRVLAVLGFAAGLATVADAATLSFENFNYCGTVTRYASEADARADVGGTSVAITTRTNGANSTLANAPDGAFFARDGSNHLVFNTLWYFNPQDAARRDVSGWGHPNNTNTGFVKLFDTNGVSVSTLDMRFNADSTVFTLSATGGGAAPSSRLWSGSNETTYGTYLDYSLDFTATFGTTGPVPGEQRVDPLSVSGAFKALFRNNDGTYLRAALVLGTGSVAERDNCFAPHRNGTTYANSTTPLFQADVAAVPLPASALPALGATRRIKQRMA